MTHRIVLDTDLGSDVDDALCLALALASPEIELVAVTHVSGDTRLRARITRRLLDLAGRADIPVYAGCEQSRSGANSFVWFGNEGKGILDTEPHAEAETIFHDHAVDAIIRLFGAATDLELVAVGPLTNVAAALDRDPSLAGRIKQLTIMGGHIRRVEYGGQVFPPIVDYNLCSDPAASQLVLGAGIPTRLVPTDVTMQVWMTAGELQQLETSSLDLHRALARAVHLWTPIMRQLFGATGAAMDEDHVAFLHDPLAMACVYEQSFCTFEDLPIEPVVYDGIFRTVEHARPTGATHQICCATAVDAPRFRAHFIDRLLRNTSPAAEIPSPVSTSANGGG